MPNLKSLHLQNFTVFENATFSFGRHLNVFIGENGTGKTHVLKVLYAGLRAGADYRRSHSPEVFQFLPIAYLEKLEEVFRLSSSTDLLARSSLSSSSSASFRFSDSRYDTGFGLEKTGKMVWTSCGHDEPLHISDDILFLPTRELLSIYPGFVSLYETVAIPFEGTYRDTCILLGKPPLRRLNTFQIQLLAIIEERLGGNVVLEGDRFYLQTESSRFPMHMVAEGHRKLAMLAQLILNGTIKSGTFLFWDEPEANLNLKLVSVTAKVIMELSKAGVQVFLATHSLFLLRELDVLQYNSQFTDLNCQYFGLHLTSNGVTVEQGPTIDHIGDITALDEELDQAEAYMNLNRRQAALA